MRKRFQPRAQKLSSLPHRPWVSQEQVLRSAVLLPQDKLAAVRLKCESRMRRTMQGLDPGSSTLETSKHRDLSDTESLDERSLAEAHEVSQDLEDKAMELCQQPLYLRPSPFVGRPCTIFFRNPYDKDGEQKTAKMHKLGDAKKSELSLGFNIHGKPYHCITNVLKHSGLVEDLPGRSLLLFDMPANKVQAAVRKLKTHQKLNHFSGCWNIGRKDWLYLHLSNRQREFPQQFNFVPKTYLLDYQRDYFESIRGSTRGKLWIIKPVDAACGRGVRLLTRKSKLPRGKGFLVSEYISSPHLINGYKYDLRIYVLVTGVQPLRVYMYEEGLVRFATEKYSLRRRQVCKRFIHLTNFSVNKKSKTFNSAESAQKFKWSFPQLCSWYEQHGVDHRVLFGRVKDLVVKTVIALESRLQDVSLRSYEKRGSCFEMYGFDVLVDSELKPWLMEVNVCPSLASSSEFDRSLKHSLLADILNLVGVPVVLRKDWAERKLFKKEVLKIEAQGLENLPPEGWNLLFQIQEEYERRGRFQRLFPEEATLEQYLTLFEVRRKSNQLMRHFVGRDKVLEQVFSRGESRSPQ